MISDFWFQPVAAFAIATIFPCSILFAQESEDLDVAMYLSFSAPKMDGKVDETASVNLTVKSNIIGKTKIRRFVISKTAVELVGGRVPRRTMGRVFAECSESQLQQFDQLHSNAIESMKNVFRKSLRKVGGRIENLDESEIIDELELIYKKYRKEENGVLIPAQKRLVQQYRAKANFENAPFKSVINSSVFAELELTDEQKKKIEAIGKDLESSNQKLKEKVLGQIEKVTNARHQSVVKALEPDQRSKLNNLLGK